MTVKGNTAGHHGGGVYVYAYYTASTFAATEVSSNTALEGGGMYHEGAPMVASTATMSGNKPNDRAPDVSCL